MARVPDIKAARAVENTMHLMALILEVALFLALYWALRRTSLAPALFGSVLGILGIAVTMERMTREQDPVYGSAAAGAGEHVPEIGA